jgi:site-specific recombinase XerD
MTFVYSRYAVSTLSASPVISRRRAKPGPQCRRLCTVAGLFRYAEEEGLIDHSPAVHVRRPRLDYESHATGLDRNELGALLVAAGLSTPRDHALISLLALNGLRVSEALAPTSKPSVSNVATAPSPGPARAARS